MSPVALTLVLLAFAGPARGQGAFGFVGTVEVQRIQMNVPAGASGTISVRTLTYKPQKASAKEFDQGNQASRKGLYAEAVRHFREAVRLDPGYILAHAQLGYASAATGQPEAALECFEKVLPYEPRWALLHFNMAVVSLRLKRPADAERSARRVMQLGVTFPDAHYALGLALVQQNKFTDEAVRQFEIGAERFPVEAAEALAKIREYRSTTRANEETASAGK